VLFVLPDGPESARWLTAAERDAILLRLREDSRSAGREAHTLGEALSNGRVWLIAVAHFLLIPVTLYGVGFWMPQIIKTASGRSDAIVGLLTAIPYAAGAVAMVLAGRHSDRTGERRWHVAAGALVGAIGLVSATAAVGTMSSVTALSVAMIGLASIFGPFWAMATGAARGVGAAAAIALINSVGNTGGFVGPYLLGTINDATHSFAAGLLVIAALMLTGGGLLLLVRQDV
jgi:cyanate permease